MIAKGLFPLAILFVTISLSCPAFAAWDRTGNVTEHSYIQLRGYMDDVKIYQTDKGYNGQKLVVGTQGSGIGTRRQHAEVTGDEISFTESAYLQYRPYTIGSGGTVTEGAVSESDLRNALCAKNYEVGSVISESYSNLTYLIKDTTIYQNDNVSVYQIGSSFRGTGKIGARVKDGPTGVTMLNYGGTYVGDVSIREEIGVGDVFYLTCP